MSPHLDPGGISTAAPDEGGERPPPGVRTMAGIRWALIVLSAVAAVWTWAGYVSGRGAPGEATGAAVHSRYQCPMHPQIVSDEPGECPICHMRLVPIAADRAGGSAATPPRVDDGRPQSVPGSGGSASPPSIPPGTRPITVSFDRLQSIGVRTGVAEERDLSRALRVTASVVAPEQGRAEVHARAAGFVEWMSVRETGLRVGAGQALLGLYSPDIYAAENELVAAKGFGESGVRSVEAARTKLELLGVPRETLDSVLESGKPVRVTPVSSPQAGFVTKKSVVVGSYVTPETALYEVVDLSRVYVVADVSSRDISAIPVGVKARFVPSSRPDKAVEAKVDLVYPQLDLEARTVRVRMQVANEKLELRPGEYGTVELTAAGQRGVVIPRDAVVDTGRYTYVFLVEGEGRFSPREVTLGGDLDGSMISVLSGLAPGDRIATSAVFLLDSESRLQASLSRSTLPDPVAQDSGAP